MRLIDADELKGKMSIRKFMVGRHSDADCLVEDAPTIDAIPVAWICALIRQEENRKNYSIAQYLTDLIWEWHQEDDEEEKEQEAR